MKKEKTTSIAEKFVKTNAIFSAILRFANTQSRRISAVTHIKILSAEHAQTNASMPFSGTLASVFFRLGNKILGLILKVR